MHCDSPHGHNPPHPHSHPNDPTTKQESFAPLIPGVTAGSGHHEEFKALAQASALLLPLVLNAGEAAAKGGEYGILEGRSFAFIHPIVMGALFLATGWTGYLGWQWRTIRTLAGEIKCVRAWGWVCWWGWGFGVWQGLWPCRLVWAELTQFFFISPCSHIYQRAEGHAAEALGREQGGLPRLQADRADRGQSASQSVRWRA